MPGNSLLERERERGTDWFGASRAVGGSEAAAATCRQIFLPATARKRPCRYAQRSRTQARGSSPLRLGYEISLMRGGATFERKMSRRNQSAPLRSWI